MVHSPKTLVTITRTYATLNARTYTAHHTLFKKDVRLHLSIEDTSMASAKLTRWESSDSYSAYKEYIFSGRTLNAFWKGCLVSYTSNHEVITVCRVCSGGIRTRSLSLRIKILYVIRNPLGERLGVKKAIRTFHDHNDIFMSGIGGFKIADEVLSCGFCVACFDAAQPLNRA